MLDEQHAMTTEHEEYLKVRDFAVNALVKWAKTGKNELAARYQTNKFLELSGANNLTIGGKEGIIEHRKLCTSGLAIRCIALLSSQELEKVDCLLKQIAVYDAPMPKRSHGLSR